MSLSPCKPDARFSNTGAPWLRGPTRKRCLRLRGPAKIHRVEERRDTPIAFLFPGQGAQYARMGAQLNESEPVFRDALAECSELLRPELGLDLRDLLFSTDDDAKAPLARNAVHAAGDLRHQLFARATLDVVGIETHSADWTQRR